MYMRGGADESTQRFTEMCTPDISVIPAPSVRPSYLYSRSLYSWANNAILKTFIHPHLIVRFWELWTKVCPITLPFIHWIHTNAVDTMACLRHSTPRNTNRMWMADIKYFTRKLEASKIWLNSTLSSFDSSVSGGYLFNPSYLCYPETFETNADISRCK